MDMSVLHKKVDIKITIAILSLEIFAALLSLVLIVYPNIHVKPVKASTSTGITIDYSTPVGTVSKNLFGESIEMEGGHLAKMVVDPYLSKSKNIGFTNVRMGGTSCETSYKWEDHTGATDTQNYVNWVKYSKLITGGTITGGGILTGGVVTGGVEPILCVNLTRSDYSDSATNWVKDMKDKGINVTYFEMGNEDIFQMNQTVCGTANPATCYAQRAQTACAAMKGINSNIKCGINLASSAYNDWWNRPVINGVANADFVIPHLYSPNAYFDTNYFYDVASKTFSGAPTTGNYAITVAARLRDQTNGNTAYNCQPKLKVQIGTQSQEFVPTIADWQTFTFDVSNPGTDQIILSNSGNLWNDVPGATSGCKVALYYANLKAASTNIAVWDKADWTGSFLGASELMRSEIKNVKSLTSKDIYVTEYNFNYDPFTKYIYSSYIDWKSCLSDPIDWQNCHFGWAPQQYDWRSYLFTALELNTMIQEGVKEAAVWSDVASGYWSYSNDGGTQNYPLYYVLNSYANKTGNQLVPYSTTNLRTYSSNSVISDSAGKATNVPYLSIVPTKDVSKNKIYLTVVNRNQNSFETVDLNFNGVNITGNVTITTLQGTTLDSHPYKDNILITPKVSTIAVTNNAITTYQIPRYSIVFFEASTGSTIPTLTANCSASPTLANINQNVIFSSVVSGGNTPYTYSWLLTGACTGSSAICSVSFATAGVKTANLTVKSNDGQSRSASCPVSVGTYITVISPNGGERWAAGTKQTIRWTPSSTGTVRLEIRKGTSQYVMIGSGGIPDTGSYVWSIPTGFALASDYRVRVTRSDGAGPYDESNNPFSVITTKKW